MCTQRVPIWMHICIWSWQVSENFKCATVSTLVYPTFAVLGNFQLNLLRVMVSVTVTVFFTKYVVSLHDNLHDYIWYVLPRIFVVSFGLSSWCFSDTCAKFGITLFVSGFLVGFFAKNSQNLTKNDKNWGCLHWYGRLLQRLLWRW